MAIRADSYSSAEEVLPLTRYIMRGETTFNSTTRPTLTEVEKFVDRVSGVLNNALAGAGFATPFNTTTANSTAVLSCDDWVTAEAASWVELTQPGTGLNELEGSRAGTFRGLHDRAMEFVKANKLGWKRQGVTVTYADSDGLQYTGLKKRSQRADVTDTTLEQPKFRRGLFDNDDSNSTSIWGG